MKRPNDFGIEVIANGDTLGQTFSVADSIDAMKGTPSMAGFVPCGACLWGEHEECARKITLISKHSVDSPLESRVVTVPPKLCCCKLLVLSATIRRLDESEK